MPLWFEFGVAVLEPCAVARALGRGETVKERYTEMVLVMLIAIGVGIHAGAFVASITLR